MITDRIGLHLVLPLLCTVVSPPRTCYNLSTADKYVLILFFASLLLCSNFKLYCSPLVVFSSFFAKGQTVVSIMIRMNLFSSLASFVLQTEVPIQLRETKILYARNTYSYRKSAFRPLTFHRVNVKWWNPVLWSFEKMVITLYAVQGGSNYWV